MNHFYRHLNKDKDEERWSQWLSHRNEINKLIERTITKGTGVQDVIVLGAGNCDDLDLGYLASISVGITLVDIDGESTEQAVRLLEPSVQDKIKLIKDTDFTKLDQVQFNEHFQTLLENRATYDQLSSFIKNIGCEIGNYNILDHLKHHFSLVISSAVYSQLFYIQALSIFAAYTSNYAEHEIRSFVEALKSLRNALVKQYNETLVSLVKPGGSIVLWTDIVKIDAGTTHIEEMLYLIPTEEERLTYVFDLFSKYGIEAALIGLQDLIDKLNPVDRVIACWIWPFSHEKRYITIGIGGSPLNDSIDKTSFQVVH